MARVRLCVCGSWFVGREGQAAHPRAPGQCLHFECRGAPARVRAWRCEGRPPLPHHFVCVEKSTLPYLTAAVGAPSDPSSQKSTKTAPNDVSVTPVPQAVLYLRGPQLAAIAAAHVASVLPMVRLVLVPGLVEDPVARRALDGAGRDAAIATAGARRPGRGRGGWRGAAGPRRGGRLGR